MYTQQNQYIACSLPCMKKAHGNARHLFKELDVEVEKEVRMSSNC